MEPAQAFEEIGKLMTGWAARLPVRDTQHNDEIRAKLQPLERKAAWDLSFSERDERDQLRKSLVPLRSLARLKAGASVYDAVFKGSPKMDPGAPFMLMSNNAKVDEDMDVAVELLRLMKLAKPGWQPDSIMYMAIEPLIGEDKKRSVVAKP